MRVDLEVPFAEKDEAKRLGARWDLARKVWYVVNVEDLTPFSRWFKTLHRLPHKPHGGHKPRRMNSPPVITERTDLSLPTCDCATPPWDDCWHTAPQLDDDQAEHMRSIAAG